METRSCYVSSADSFHGKQKGRARSTYMSEFEGKVAVITGGGGGIGKATAARLLDEGASVVLSSRRQEVLDAAQRELDPAGGRVALAAGGVSSAGAAERAVELAL